MISHLLIISENEHHGALLRSKLAEFSPIIITGRAALTEPLSHIQISFIIIDNFSEQKALQIVHAITSNPNTKSAPLLAINNSLRKDYIHALKAAGVIDFIPLPIESIHIAKMLLDIQKAKRETRKTEQIVVPNKLSQAEPLDTRQVIDQESISHVKAALKNGTLITLALVEGPYVKDTENLTLQIKEGLCCVISLTKGRKALLESLKKQAKEKFNTGIVSSVKKPYTSIAEMLDDAAHALKRAKETPYGYSF